jgi:hypothetical protein
LSLPTVVDRHGFSSSADELSGRTVQEITVCKKSTILKEAPIKERTPDWIVRVAMAAWQKENFAEFLDQFNDQFTLTDYADRAD